MRLGNAPPSLATTSTDPFVNPLSETITSQGPAEDFVQELSNATQDGPLEHYAGGV